MPHLSSQTAGRLGPSSSSAPSVHTREKKPQTECQISVDNGFTGTEYSLSGMAGRSKTRRPARLQNVSSSLWIHLCPHGTLPAGELRFTNV